jgi:uncharacterized protein
MQKARQVRAGKPSGAARADRGASFAQLALLFGLSLAAAGFGGSPLAAAIDIPPLQGRVNDHANMLSAAERSALENKLAAYEQKTGQQFTLLTVPTLDGQPLEEFGIKALDAWKVGDKKRDDGLILIIVPNDRKMRIELGYGLEGSIPDVIAARITRDILTPALRAGQIAQGINGAFDALMQAASGEAPPQAADAQPQRARGKKSAWGTLSPLILPIVLFIIFSSFFGGGGGRRRRGGFYGGPFIGGGWGGGGWGGGGGGWGGGGGGGGFSGGGGGGGGGGASGSW